MLPEKLVSEEYMERSWRHFRIRAEGMLMFPWVNAEAKTLNEIIHTSRRCSYQCKKLFGRIMWE